MMMKKLLAFVFVVTALWGCISERPAFFTIASVKEIGTEGGALSLEVTSSAQSWIVKSNKTWCVPRQASGSRNKTIVLDIEPNPSPVKRTAELLFMVGASDVVERFRVTQKGTGQSDQLTVVFHVLYNNPSDPNQNVPTGNLAEVIESVNFYFNDKVQTGIVFAMAEFDPDGQPLAEPGVHRIQYQGAMPIDQRQMMVSKNNEFKAMLWDPNQYINIFVYPFSAANVLGISHQPIMPPNHRMEGANYATVSYLEIQDVDFTFCVSLNRTYLDCRSNDTQLHTKDFVATTSHELGHFLGLHHVFAEEKGEMIEADTDTDFCQDTPSYNRPAYTLWINQYLNSMPASDYKLAEMIMRRPENEPPFASRNIMDYAVSMVDEFTEDQAVRTRHSRDYGLLLPGKQLGKGASRFTKGVTPEIPVKVIM